MLSGGYVACLPRGLALPPHGGFPHGTSFPRRRVSPPFPPRQYPDAGRPRPRRPAPSPRLSQRSRTYRRGYVRHPAVAAGRAAAHGNLRHEAGRPGRVPRRLQADSHQRPRNGSLRTPAAPRPHRRQVHSHSVDFAQLRRPRRRPQALPHRPRPQGADRHRQRLPDGRFHNGQDARGPANRPAQLRLRHGPEPQRPGRIQPSAPPTSGRPTRRSPWSATPTPRNSRSRTWP